MMLKHKNKLTHQAAINVLKSGVSSWELCTLIWLWCYRSTVASCCCLLRSSCAIGWSSCTVATFGIRILCWWLTNSVSRSVTILLSTSSWTRWYIFSATRGTSGIIGTGRTICLLPWMCHTTRWLRTSDVRLAWSFVATTSCYRVRFDTWWPPVRLIIWTSTLLLTVAILQR